MKSNRNSILVKSLALAMGIFMSFALMGCNDPFVTGMAAEHRELGNICRQELNQNIAGLPSTPQTQTFRPAP